MKNRLLGLAAVALALSGFANVASAQKAPAGKNVIAGYQFICKQVEGEENIAENGNPTSVILLQLEAMKDPSEGSKFSMRTYANRKFQHTSEFTGTGRFLDDELTRFEFKSDDNTQSIVINLSELNNDVLRSTRLRDEGRSQSFKTPLNCR